MLISPEVLRKRTIMIGINISQYRKRIFVINSWRVGGKERSETCVSFSPMEYRKQSIRVPIGLAMTESKNSTGTEAISSSRTGRKDSRD